MEQDKKRLSKRQKKKLLKTFLIAVSVTLSLCIVVIVAGNVIYNSTVGSQSVSQVTNELTEEEVKFEEEKKVVGDLNKTIAVFGVDEDEVRTDVVFVVNFNTITHKVKVVSVPRDTKVFWTEKQRRAYNQLTGNDITVSKLTEMGAYGRINQNVGNIRDFTVDELENILRIHIDSYVVINLEAFREIVDAIGGVEMYVPQDMYYKDDCQGLYINLKEGMQHLDSKNAEGLVRFRHYPMGDEARVSVQQTFLKAFAEKVKSQSIPSLAGIATRLFPYVKTDVKLNEVLSYLELLNQFDLSNLTFHTVPGTAASYEGPSYYYIDDEKLDAMITEVFLDTTVAGEQPTASNETTEGTESTEAPAINKEVSVAIYNGTTTKGIAGLYKEKLVDAGYMVSRIDNYSETDVEKSKIYAKDKANAAQFLDYLSSAEIIEDSSIEYDIEIVVGKEDIAAVQ